MIPSLVSILILFINISLGTCRPNSSDPNEPALLVVSFDAFRPDYLNRNVTPNLNQFRKDGASAPFMMNVFPTITFVNHFSIATGLYAENHGVLANSLYDLKLKKHLGYSYELFHYSNITEPIWITNEKAGRHSGCMMWAGSDFEYNNTKCTFSGIYNQSADWEERVDTAISWFNHPKTPANLVMLYLDQPDQFGHAYGYESPVITKMVAKLDNITRHIQEKLIKTGLDKRVNVIHLSDHGMNSVTLRNSIDLTKFVADNACKMYGISPILQIVPNDPAKEMEIFANLTKAAEKNGHFKVYNQKNIPARWHANNPRRMGPIFAVADIGYAFQDLMNTAKYYEQTMNISITNDTKYGIHGYDNSEPSMHATFMAKGPLFAKGKQLKPVNTVDLYNLFCLILNIKGTKNDGSTNNDTWNDLIVKSPHHSNVKGEGALWAKWALIFITSVVAIVLIMKVRYMRKQHAFTRNRERSKLILTDFEVRDEPLT